MRTYAAFYLIVSLSLILLAGPAARSQTAETVDGKLYTQKPEVAPAVGKPSVQNQEAPAKPSLFNEGSAPSWIWGADQNQKYVVRKTFQGPAKAARLRATCDNAMALFINGKPVLSSVEWQSPVEIDVQKYLKEGENVLTAEITNEGGPAGFILKLALTSEDGKSRYVVSDASWEAAEVTGGTKKWSPVAVVAKLGGGAWADVFTNGVSDNGANRGEFNLIEGFQVEKLFTVPKDQLGSWVNITCDPKGRLIVSDQGNLGLCRVTPPKIGSQDETIVERLDIKINGRQVSGAQGLLFAFDSLYVVCNDGPGSGLYRCRDTDGDDQYDKVEKLKDIPGGGEHGPHAVRLSPDGKSLFVASGNHTRLPFEIKTNAPPKTMGGSRTEQLRATLPPGMTSRLVPNWDEDLLLPRQWDGNGHAAGILAPGGWVCRVDPDGKNWEVFSSGYRNQFDFAFNADGEMFVYDADMEWDFGMPWYRPTRVVHATSGSEFGWRSGTGKWPRYYADSLPELIDIGPGSPVGVEFGYGTKFPSKYQKALYICDWTFGTMYAIHMEASGSSYKATKEEFVSRTPLPLTDCTVGKDGALYFTIGGRGAQSELFRVTYVGKEDTSPIDLKNWYTGNNAAGCAETRRRRHLIEGLHVGPADLAQLAAVESKLGNSVVRAMASPDRFDSYAARVALERLPLTAWQDLVFEAANKAPAEKNPFERVHLTNIVSNGCIGLARQGESELLPKILDALGKLDFANQLDRETLPILRAYQLALIRLGKPDPETSAVLAKKFDDLFPHKSDNVNRELAILMVYLGSPNAANKLVPFLARERVTTQQDLGALLDRNRGYGGTIAAMLANQPDQQQVHYAFTLRNLRTGWTIDQRKTYFSWFDKARKWSGGASYQNFLKHIDEEAYENATDVERLAVEATGIRKPYVAPELPKPMGPGHNYMLDEIVSLASTKLKGRDFKNGQRTYAAARCVVCHRFGGDGGATGPDLTQLAGRFNVKDLVESIVEPSKVVSDQYKASVITTDKGQVISGRVVSESNDTLTVVIDPENASKVVIISKREIEQKKSSPVSLMPADLLKTLNEDEVLDLLAYLLSRGNPQDAMFRK